MSKVWYCPNCGYEVTSRGRCHSCRERLVASSLPQLEVGEDEDEVGYRLESWTDGDRGRLIEHLNEMELLHRFEDDELVVAAEDESRVDDLIAEVAATSAGEGDIQWFDDTAAADPVDALDDDGDDPMTGDSGAQVEVDQQVAATIRLLADAAERLRADPTDMHADSDVAEASAGVFMTDHFGSVDAETWSAIGRVTRRLLSVLGADEALEDGIRFEAGVLCKLLAPLVDTGEVAGLDSHRDESEQTVYELPEWLPEQRAQLGLLLDEAGIAYEWEHAELVVPSDRESDVEALFPRIGGPDGTEDEEGAELRYQAVAELFAACGRLASEPVDEQRAEAVLHWAHESEGPPLLGMDEVDWFRIMNRARILSGAISDGRDPDLIREQATTLHDLLRAIV